MLVILVGSIIGATIYANAIIKRAQEEPFEVRLIPYSFQVADYAAFNLDDDEIHFGTGVPGSMLSRSINLTTNEPARVEVLWSGYGNLSATDNDFTFGANELKEITFYVHIPKNESVGNYSGFVQFNFFKYEE